MADHVFAARDEDVVLRDEVILVCARCGMEICGEPVRADDEIYCCAGCAQGTGCTCAVA